MAQGSKGVRPILGVEVIPGRNGILSTEWRCAVAAGEGVMLKVIVAHQLNHGADVLYFHMVPLENQGSWGFIISEPVPITFNHGRSPTHVEDLRVEWDIVTWPVRLRM